MHILINASNLKAGGGLQVADSVCKELYRFPQHVFTVVLSSFLCSTRDAIERYPNVIVFEYNVQNNIQTLLFGRDKFLDKLVDERTIDAVLTVFGPSRWNPKIKHISGFAISQLLIPESPYFALLGLKDRIKFGIYNLLLKFEFWRSGRNFYTENPFISERLRKLYPNVSVFTVTNYYNQVFDHPEQWKERRLASFDGTTLLTIATPYIHKNVTISAETARLLKKQHPEFRFRFVFSFNREDFKADISGIEECFEFIGKVHISECPSLYKQCDLVFTPTLIECFTAAYAEAMRMERPTVTTDLEFARGLCGDAAEYYSATNTQACADAIYHVATDKALYERLVRKGKVQLKSFDNYKQRADKLIDIVTNKI